MKRLKAVTVGSVFLMLLFSISCNSQVQPKEVDGEMLVKQVWEAMKTTDMEFIENILAPGFQSIHQDGARNRDEQIELIRGLNMGEYVLDNFKITQNENTMNVTYFVNVTETIAGNTITKHAARLSVFSKTVDGWKWVSHANLVPLK
ncbi:MAG: nuclear transport factor 2 family protein [Candidatus Cloacimonetes bacterium]|nr:nuclear transport factor 2 family protein [Candidatus Cloacimonadota bacterium]